MNPLLQVAHWLLRQRSPSRTAGVEFSRRWVHAARAVALGVMAVLLTAGEIRAQLPAPVQTYFLALPEADVKADFQILETSSTIGSVMRSVTSITVTRDDTYIYFDQWEDGYENNISSPSRVYSASRLSGTQIWGDNNPVNGIPPGFSSDVLSSGDIIALKNDVSRAGSCGGRGTVYHQRHGNRVHHSCWRGYQFQPDV